MTTKDIKFKPAHMVGVSEIKYHPSGESFFTCGADASIRHWTKDHEPKVLNPHSEAIKALTISRIGDRLASGSEDHQVFLIKLPEFIVDKEITRFQLPVRCISFNVTGSFLACAGDDGVIKNILLMDTKQVQLLKGHEGPVRYLQFDPKDEFLISSGCDGNVIVWNTNDNSKVVCLNTFLSKNEIEDHQYCKFDWSPNGDFLALPGKEDVTILNRTSWTVERILKNGHSKPSTILSWSPNGKYLASVGLDKQVLIWDLSTNESLHAYKHETFICSLSWNPTANALAITDVEGRYTIWENPVPIKFPSPYNIVSLKDKLKPKEEIEELFLMDEVAPQTEKKRNRIKKKSKPSNESMDPLDIIDGVFENEAEEIEEEEMGDEEELEEQGGEEEDEGEEEIYSYEGEEDPTIYSESEEVESKPSIIASTILNPLHPNKQKSGVTRRYKPSRTWNSASLQSPFQPSASELEKKKRYLVFNKIGMVTAIDENSQTNIQIEFHDVSAHHPIKLVDRNHVTMAALGEKGAVFGSPAKENLASAITYQPIENNWGNSSKWTHQFPLNEQVESLAICNSFIAVATSLRMLRIFTYSGIKYHLLSFPGPIVSMTGHEENLAVVYHLSPPIGNSQNLGYLVLDLKNKKKLHKDSLPISPNSELKWLGFSSTGILSTYDSNGIVRMLIGEWNEWTPMLDTKLVKNSPDEHFWIIGLDSKKLNYISLNGNELSPPIFPVPVPRTLEFKIPLQCEESNNHEEMLLRESLFFEQKLIQGTAELEDSMLKGKAMLDAYVVQLIQGALKNDKPERALNLCDFLQFQRPFEAAVRLAYAANLNQLAEQMNAIMRKKFKLHEPKEQENQEDQVLEGAEDQLMDQEEAFSTNKSEKKIRNTNNNNQEEKLISKLENSKNSVFKTLGTSKNKENTSFRANTPISKTSTSELESPIADSSTYNPSAIHSAPPSKKRSRFAVEKSNSNKNNQDSGSLFESLDKLQEGSSSKKRKVQTTLFS